MVQQISLQGFPSFAIVVVPVNGSTPDTKINECLRL